MCLNEKKKFGGWILYDVDVDNIFFFFFKKCGVISEINCLVVVGIKRN